MRAYNLIIIIAAVIIVIVSGAAVLTYKEIGEQRKNDVVDLQYRTKLLADSLKEAVEPYYLGKSTSALQKIVDKFADTERLFGFAVYDSQGTEVAASKELPEPGSIYLDTVMAAISANESRSEFMGGGGQRLYILAEPLRQNTNVIGVFIIVQNASYIDINAREILVSHVIRLSIQIIVYILLIYLVVLWMIWIPVRKLANSLKSGRASGSDEHLLEHININMFFQPLVSEILKIKKSLSEARLAASEEARMRLEKLDSPWTAHRLKEFTQDMLRGRPIVVVSHLEPYKHVNEGAAIAVRMPASGLLTAIEPVIQTCGGLWIAHGSGDADRSVVDERDRIQVPPENPKYTLKRIWLSAEEEKGYSHGFSDQAMYPLCLMSHTRPVFREKDWQTYQTVNAKFAAAVLAEIEEMSRPLILIQDFQFSLIARVIKQKRPDAVVGIFWHLPWVSAEAFSICPWRKEILDGILGADLIGFHTRSHFANFIKTVARELEAKIDYDRFTVTRGGHTSHIKAYPISVAYEEQAKLSNVAEQVKDWNKRELLKVLGVKAEYIGVGVDRLDHVKGIFERLTGLEMFFDTYPQFLGRFTFIQICSPSETESETYLKFVERLNAEFDRINAKFRIPDWKPLLFLARHHSHEEVSRFYKLANLCLVTPLHDGMNLVAKEFVASRNDEMGVLILSQFTGAAEELKEALIVNPYSGKQIAQAIHAALKMNPAEQKRRMRRMRDVVKSYTIYRWAAEFIKDIAAVE
ncbi:MAG: trehalose-6-phosphate synthase [Candidatus Taylorbacteria bacterium]|nr:trehalose-6-phosphate synthase [Candidatus Taylorbacteria bacterium]